MKIISQFRDYYDQVSHVYGEDPLIVFNRKPVSNDVKLLRQAEIAFKGTYFPSSYGSQHKYAFRWLVINGLFYALVKNKLEPHAGYKVITEEVFLDVNAKRGFWGNYTDKNHTHKNYIGNPKLFKQLTDISRELRTPIFEIDFGTPTTFGDYLLTGSGIDTTRFKQPVLAELGLPAIYPAAKLFQDISYYLGNQINQTPDVEPPVEISDKDKLVGHGFDNRSFKHRI
jgi:hypothetical protein